MTSIISNNYWLMNGNESRFMDMIEASSQCWKTDPILGVFPASFNFIVTEYLKPQGKSVSSIVWENEGAEYGAVQFNVDNKTMLFRHAKHTPKKIGQFVTLWKRISSQSDIAPFDITDGIDRVLVFAHEHERFGLFVFDAAILAKQDIFSTHSEGGKRAFRVYGPWTLPKAAQARKSKEWQCSQFVELTCRETGMMQLCQAL